MRITIQAVVDREYDLSPAKVLGSDGAAAGLRTVLGIGVCPLVNRTTFSSDAAGADGRLPQVACIMQGMRCTPPDEDHEVAGLPHHLRQGQARQPAALLSLLPLRYQNFWRVHFQSIGAGLASAKVRGSIKRRIIGTKWLLWHGQRDRCLQRLEAAGRAIGWTGANNALGRLIRYLQTCAKHLVNYARRSRMGNRSRVLELSPLSTTSLVNA